MNVELSTKELFPQGLGLTEALLSETLYPWEILPAIGAYIKAIGTDLDQESYEKRPNNVWVAKSAIVAPSAFLGHNIIIGPGTVIRHCAFLRNDILIGEDCVIGNSSELKNSILIKQVQVPHFNYIGDSVLGTGVHLGAGAITSNIKSDRTDIVIRFYGKKLATGLRKMGAMIGDHAEIGCNSVLNPGTVIGAGSRIYPLSLVRGYVPANSIYKNTGEVTEILNCQ